MPITIEHRRDGLLQQSEGKKTPEDPSDNYTAEVTYPTHAMLLDFLDKYVVGKQFENEETLQATLALWPAFAQENGLELKSEWSEISADLLNKHIRCGDSLDSDLIIGFIHALAN